MGSRNGAKQDWGVVPSGGEAHASRITRERPFGLCAVGQSDGSDFSDMRRLSQSLIWPVHSKQRLLRRSDGRQILLSGDPLDSSNQGNLELINILKQKTQDEDVKRY